MTTLTREEQRELAQAEKTLRKYAAEDPNAFIPYVLRHEKTGKFIQQAPMHIAWQDEATQYSRLTIWSSIEHGKSFQVSVGRTLFELGNNPSMAIAIVSNTQGQAKKFALTVKKYIEDSEELHQVFPNLKPGDPWTDTAFTVQRPVFSKDYSVQAIGVHGALLGARIDLLILDDIVDFENCRTQEQRDTIWAWIQSTLLGRLTKNGRLIVVGTAWHPQDALHKFAVMPGMRALRYPVLDDNGQPRWPEVWPMERIEQKRLELTAIEFARQLMCVARDDAESRFKLEWIQTGLKRGNGKELMYSIENVPPGYSVYTGVDLGVKQKKKSDKTSLFTILVHPDKSRQIIGIETVRITGPDIIRKIVDTHNRYHSIVYCESNAAQDYIIQFTHELSAVPIFSFVTGENKANVEFGVESLAAEIAGGKWIIPNKDGVMDPEVLEWVNEMLYYNPLSHTGDRLMSSWIAREGSRQGSRTVEFGTLDLASR